MTTRAVAIDAALLRRWPLPQPGADGDKEERGRVMVVAGSLQMPGAALLAATAALRAGAGKLSVATADGVAPGVALLLPEAMVIGLATSSDGELRPSDDRTFRQALSTADAVLVGPGWTSDNAAFVGAMQAGLGERAALVLDAAAMSAIKAGKMSRPALLTPHAGEMAKLLDISREAVRADPAACATRGAAAWGCVVVLKGATTFIAAPSGELWCHEGGSPGLGTSGSGDTLAGLIAGLAARGAPLPQAGAWGVAIHARAGRSLAQKMVPLGYLARELPAEFPALLSAASNA